MASDIETVTIVKDKDSTQKPIMQKENDLMLGYANLQDLATSLFGLKMTVINFIGAVIAVATTFITDYIWNDAKAVYMLLFLVGIDAITGIAKAIKAKTFSSAKLPRVLVIMIAYTTLLGIAWNLSKISPFYDFLPAILYGGFISTLLISIFENLHFLNLIPTKMYNYVRKKLDLIQVLVFGGMGKKDKK